MRGKSRTNFLLFKRVKRLKCKTLGFKVFYAA
jgi:hypothetical protein